MKIEQYIDCIGESLNAELSLMGETGYSVTVKPEGGEVMQLKIFVARSIVAFDLPGRASLRPSPPRQEGDLGIPVA